MILYGYLVHPIFLLFSYFSMNQNFFSPMRASVMFLVFLVDTDTHKFDIILQLQKLLTAIICAESHIFPFLSLLHVGRVQV